MGNQGSVKVLISVLLVLALMGCSTMGQPGAGSTNVASGNAANMEQETNPQSVPVDRALVSANTAFGVKLFKLAVGESGSKNVLISPSSIAICLAMAYNGAEGETKQAMSRALETGSMSVDELNRAYAALLASLANPSPKVQLQIANSLWARQEIQFNQEFIGRNKKFFGAEVTNLDFGSPTAAATINSWVNDKTKGKIDKIVDRIDGQSLLFLINAIYFKGAWAAEFDKSKTKEENFSLAAGQTKRVQMMSQSGEYKYHETDSFQAVSLPYVGNRVSMYIVLPKNQSGLGDLVSKLTAETWNSWMGRLSSTKGSISLPRFKLQYEITLNDALRALGMGIAFEAEHADFSGMFKGAQNGFISQVKHKTFAEVNEEGTEAAAVTSAEIRATSVRPVQKPFNMVVDHPFLCAIRDNQTGTVLFIGAIADPMQ